MSKLSLKNNRRKRKNDVAPNTYAGTYRIPIQAAEVLRNHARHQSRYMANLVSAILLEWVANHPSSIWTTAVTTQNYTQE